MVDRIEQMTYENNDLRDKLVQARGIIEQLQNDIVDLKD